MASLVRTRTRPPHAQYDMLLIWVFIALLSVGLVMVYSSSIATAEGSKFTNHQANYYLIRQSIFIAVGLLAGIIAFQVPVQLWDSLLVVSHGLTILLILANSTAQRVNQCPFSL